MKYPLRDLPPAILSFLAPAKRCNQSCPSCYLTEVVDEPVRVAALSPDDYAAYVEQFVAAGVPILGLTFQGYEVTLPGSWPYLEATFAVARRYGISRSFITNGMLLHKYADRIVANKPVSISVSLDGASPDVNDPLRGLRGAFAATIESISKFLSEHPAWRERLAVASCLYAESNYDSLLEMPEVLARFGIQTWRLGFELTLQDNRVVPAMLSEERIERLTHLQEAADRLGISCHVNDEFGSFQGTDTGNLHIERLFDPGFLYRLDPLGTVRNGDEMLTRWTPETARRWDPKNGDALEASGYWARNASIIGERHAAFP